MPARHRPPQHGDGRGHRGSKLNSLFLIVFIFLFFGTLIFFQVQTRSIHSLSLNSFGIPTDLFYRPSECTVDDDCSINLWCSLGVNGTGSSCVPFQFNFQPCGPGVGKCAPSADCRVSEQDSSISFCDPKYRVGCSPDGRCHGHGVCGPKGVCVCDPQWTGSDCSTAVHEQSLLSSSRISTTSCSGNGFRRNSMNGPCTCYPGFAGTVCEYLADVGDENENASCVYRRTKEICSNRGDCISPEGGAGARSCRCQPPWFGRYCENHDANAAAISRRDGKCLPHDDNACSLHGRCSMALVSDPVGSCECFPGWKGPNCQFCDADNVEVTCSRHGRCLAATGRCACSPGWGGYDCSACLPGFYGPNCLPCRCANGMCRDGFFGDGKCICPSNFAGKRCDTPFPCTSDSACSGHGKCDASGSGTCKCRSEYIGRDCSVRRAVRAEGGSFTTLVLDSMPGESGAGNASISSPTTVMWGPDEYALDGHVLPQMSDSGEAIKQIDRKKYCAGSDECAHGGTCTEGRCECMFPYSGPFCTVLRGGGGSSTLHFSAQGYGFTELSSCADLHCSSHGTCVSNNDTTPTANKTVGAVGIESDGSNGTIVVSTVPCICEAGWTGADCSVAVSGGTVVTHIPRGRRWEVSCATDDDCGENGLCDSTDSRCRCKEGWANSGPDDPCSRCASGYFFRVSFFGPSCVPCFPDGLEECRRDTEYIHILLCYDCHSIHGRHPKYGIRTTLRSTVMNAADPGRLFFHIMTLPGCVNDHMPIANADQLGDNYVDPLSGKDEWLGVRSFIRNVRRELNDQYGNILMEYGALDYERLGFMSSFVNSSRLYNPLVIGHHLYSNEVFPGLEKLIVLDTDTLVIGDISRLWGTSMKNKPLMAVPICTNGFLMRDAFNFSEPLIRSRFKPTACTFSNGVCVVNMSYWRANDLTSEAVRWSRLNMEHGGRLAMWLTEGKDLTKSLMNLMFANHLEPMKSSWNMAPGCFVSDDRLVTANILHYSGLKPWDRRNQRGFCKTSGLYFRYAGVTMENSGSCEGWKCGKEPVSEYDRSTAKETVEPEQ